MLNRQKAVLEFIRLAGGEVERLVLTKWCFLLRHETTSQGGASFYDFVPYQYGPFSFGLYQETDKLVSQGYLCETTGSKWALGEVPARTTLDRAIHRDIASILSRFQQVTRDDLLDYVYTRHPAYTVNSRRQKLAKIPEASNAVYTAGYEGKSVDAFLNGLTCAGIRRLIDVRQNPVARRYGFHRSTLDRLCGKLGIEYCHMPNLGIPSELRQDLASIQDYKRLFELYEKTTLKTEQRALEKVAGWIADSPSVLVCMEANPTCCHRARLAVPISRLTGLPIIHLN